ncbi:hypothetical protein FHR31_001609 [Parvibacter caecicola]|uniref:Uncharacterized protein n=1 Tax=Parvibacter caecicola TaxID=747645 RepID=A0A7W5GR03_9ACTN|nr:hypothetical protein [Parvibacter caecicola]
MVARAALAAVLVSLGLVLILGAGEAARCGR